MTRRSTNLTLLFFMFAQTLSANEELEERSSFTIPLPRLSVVLQRFSEDVEEIRVRDRDSRDESIITPFDDMSVKRTKDGETRQVFREPPGPNLLISEFEAGVLDEVCKGFVRTLAILERDLQRRRWDRLLYLDSYFPRFLRGFSYLFCAARGQKRPTGALMVAENLFDVSESSPKSDERIQYWRDNPEYLLRLRIVTKELIYQLRLWQKHDIGNSRRNPEICHGDKVEQALGLFLRMYFNTRPHPVIPVKKKT